MIPTLEERRIARASLPPKIKALVPDPYEDELCAIAAEMARPIVFGWMRGREAYAALALKAHTLPVEDPDASLKEAWRTLRAHVGWRRKTRRDIEWRINRALKPMLEQRAPRNYLLATAHDINGATGFLYTEEEINDLVALEVYYSLPQAPRRRRRGS